MGFAVGEAEEVLWWKETRAHGKETSSQNTLMNFVLEK
jgi:hypothetical protein